MSRKKSCRGQLKPQRRNLKMDSRFNCPKCHNEQTVQCKVDKSDKIGIAYCIICEASYSCKSHNLMCPIDIYTNWIDEVENEENDVE
ncbi:hypothetical protein SLOPH_2393 [Spraguea lophii 42_110]|uniref:Transcription elongation factor 1 homolog n=1 Tax=Spraguea lophii (strain 42_110) TaxID=1358809 RepID=S7WC28_SPRLO|nr:hypothetical protein SLOPH_2393 [Spraguea lophii 42_110]